MANTSSFDKMIVPLPPRSLLFRLPLLPPAEYSVGVGSIDACFVGGTYHVRLDSRKLVFFVVTSLRFAKSMRFPVKGVGNMEALWQSQMKADIKKRVAIKEGISLILGGEEKQTFNSV